MAPFSHVEKTLPGRIEDFVAGGEPDIDAEGVVSWVEVVDADEDEMKDNQLPDLETPLLLLVTDGETGLDEHAAQVDLDITEIELFILDTTIPLSLALSLLRH